MGRSRWDATASSSSIENGRSPRSLRATAGCPIPRTPAIRVWVILPRHMYWWTSSPTSTLTSMSCAFVMAITVRHVRHLRQVLVSHLTLHAAVAYLHAMPQRHDQDEILTPSQIAAEWHVSVRTVQRYIANGQIKATRLPSGYARVRRSDAEAALTRAA